ncbi:MAG: DUF4294 domain-containing protein [Flavobacteriales bacterium]
MKYVIVLFLFCFNLSIPAQEEYKDSIDIQKDIYNKKDIEGSIEQIDFWAKPIFKDEADKKRFLYIKRKVYKVWPYVQMAQKLYKLNQEETSGFGKRRLVRKYNREIQDSLMKKYKNTLKNFSRTDGRVMMKLIHRQTGETTYEIVKKSKSGWSAFWWNTQAGFFKLNMKDTLDIKNNRDDYFVEYITNEGILNGRLKTEE